MAVLAAIDIGTNSIHLILVDVDESTGSAHQLRKEREMVRLGAGEALKKRRIGRKAFGRGVEAIARFAALARAAGADEIRAVATSAVREASNGREFVEAVRGASGIEVRIIDGAEEARLIQLGVARGYPLHGRVACIVDIGGGSTEVIVADADRPRFLRSVRLGSLRLYEEFLAGHDPIDPGDYRRLQRHVARTLRPLGRSLREYGFDVVIATSGTALGLAGADAAARGLAPGRVHGYELTASRLRGLQRSLLRMTIAQRRRVPGMNPRRADIIVAGAAVLLGVLELLGRSSLIVCDRALREGLVAEFVDQRLERATLSGDPHAVRAEAVHEFAVRFGAGGEHEHTVVSLALSLFDQTRTLHALGSADRELLYAAAMLHDVGRFLSLSSHHKHSAYLIRNADLRGWAPGELVLVSAVARYHRRSMPKERHPEFALLSPEARDRVAKLAGLLRVADALDARKLGVVTGVRADLRAGALAVDVEAAQEIGAEIEAARAKSDLLAAALGAPVTMRAVHVDRDADHRAVAGY
ncbi:MAG TPA: Ppx/GppA phosphatase family protein [Candidatus Dormibacteraeota bacterium]|nr:Ppx/GppA phosphatase family protein [Candidatus Dormibacteraeota bacterium]